eukprot:7735626-Ditylum_brightwellii.AAC.1
MKSANKWYDEGIFEMLGKAERTINESGGLRCIGQDECSGEVRVLTRSHEKPGSPKDNSLMEEIPQSKGG